jgi:hypothetical protein
MFLPPKQTLPNTSQASSSARSILLCFVKVSIGRVHDGNCPVATYIAHETNRFTRSRCRQSKATNVLVYGLLFYRDLVVFWVSAGAHVGVS